MNAWDPDALALVTSAVTALGGRPRALTRTRLLPIPVTDGSCQGRLRVYMNHAA